MVGKETEMNTHLVGAQRNAFLCGFTVFFYFILTKTSGGGIRAEMTIRGVKRKRRGKKIGENNYENKNKN